MPCGDKLSEASRADTNFIMMRTTEGDLARIRRPFSKSGSSHPKVKATFKPVWPSNRSQGLRF